MAAPFVRQQPLERLGQRLRVANFDTRLRCQQVVDRVAKAEMVRPEEHRNTLYCRFDHVVAALVAAPGKQAAAHVRDVGGAVQRPQLTHRVHQQHAAAAGRCRAAGIDFRLAYDLQGPCFKIRLDAGGVRGIARHQDEPEPRAAVHQRAVAFGHDPVLAVAQAPADDDHVLRRVVQCLPRIGRRRPVGHRQVVLHVPRDCNARRGNAQPAKPRSVGVALYGDQLHLYEQPRNQPCSGVDAAGPCRHLAVDDRHGDGPLMR